MDIQALPPNAKASAELRSSEAPEEESTPEADAPNRVDDGFEEELLAWLKSSALPETAWIERALGRDPSAATGGAETAIPANGAETTIAAKGVETAPNPSPWTPNGPTFAKSWAASSGDAWLPGASRAEPELRATEETANLRKLLAYVDGHRADGRNGSPEAAPKAQPAEPMKLLVSDEPPAERAQAADNSQTARASTPVKTSVETPNWKNPAPGLAAAGPELTGLDLGSGEFGGRDPAQTFGRMAAEASANESTPSQLASSARRLMAEAKQRPWSPNARVPLELRLDEAQVPMRLRISPTADGQHQVKFLVQSPEARRELRKLLPEIETTLAELPIEVADVQVQLQGNQPVATRSAK